MFWEEGVISSMDGFLCSSVNVVMSPVTLRLVKQVDFWDRMKWFSRSIFPLRLLDEEDLRD